MMADGRLRLPETFAKLRDIQFALFGQVEHDSQPSGLAQQTKDVDSSAVTFGCGDN